MILKFSIKESDFPRQTLEYAGRFRIFTCMYLENFC
jgi:hypothetical protein